MSEKIQVLFVDDEPNILNGLKRLMRGQREEWEMNFCSSGQEALDLLARQTMDVVVSDMRMPGMDGAQLLDQVRKLFPGTIRVILSGYADSESVLRTVGPAHVYLAKPCDPLMLKDAITRPLALRKRLSCPEMRTLLAGLTSLPSLPDVFLNLQAELQSPRSSAASVAEIISRDVAMTAEILRLTNSAYFSTPAKVTSPLLAVRTLGLEIIQSLVLRIGIFRQFSGSSNVVPLLQELNDYSLSISKLAEAIAKSENMEHFIVTSAQCAGMLSSIGILVLLDAKGSQYHDLLRQLGPKGALHRAEFETFGLTHNLIGAYLLSLWGFSDAVIEAVAFAPEPGNAEGGENPALTAVHAAQSLGPRFPELPNGAEGLDMLDYDYISKIKRHDRIETWRALAEQLKAKE
ncbi:MAG: response regulator [Rhodospirillales bacterium]|nr:MAG: response regulator [Rhodospirillales bacterium]